jgi:hypothetical protein
MTNIYLKPTFPSQKKKLSEKTKEWREQCVDSIIELGNQSVYNGRSSKYKKQVNYNLIVSEFDEEDFEYVANPYNLPTQLGNTPVKLQNFNIIRPKYELLKGEEIKRPFNFRVVGSGGEVTKTIDEKRREAIQQSLEEHLLFELGEGQQDEKGNMIPPKGVEQILKHFDENYRDIREQMGNTILQHLVKSEHLILKFNQGWEHALISAEEIYYVGIVSNEPKVRVVNTLDFDYDRNPNLQCIEDAQWCREDRYLNIGQILDEFGEYLSEEDVKRLDNGEISGLKGYNGHPYTMTPGTFYEGQSGYDDRNYLTSKQSSPTYQQTSDILVSNCCWKSMKKIGFVSYTDEFGLQETTVEDDFKITKELKESYPDIKVEWQWINEVWMGTKIGEDIYVNIEPLPNQNRSIDNPSICKLPYVGRVYNNLNSKATSLVDLIKPHQYTYIIVWYRLMNELAKAKGKKFIMDFGLLPKSQGWTVGEWMYYFDNMGVAWVNSHEEGREGDPSTVSKFNQIGAGVDMTLSNTVGQYLDILNKLEDMAGELCGVSRQRQGQISSSETVGGVERSVLQSSYVTEQWFMYHNEVKRQVLTQLLNAAKIAYINGKKSQFILNDTQRVFLDIDGPLFNDSDYDVHMSNSSKDNMIKDKLEQLAQVALQTDKAKLSDIITIIKSDSISEISNKIISGENDQIERQQQQIESQNQAMLEAEQMRQQTELERLDREDKNKELDRQNKIEVAEINAFSFSEDKDVDNNGIPDILEIEKLRQKSAESLLKNSIEQRKINQDSVEADKQRNFESEQSEKQRKHEKELAEKEAKLWKEEMVKKEKIEKYKARNKKPNK